MVVLTTKPGSSPPLGWNGPGLSHSSSFVAPPSHRASFASPPSRSASFVAAPSMHYSLVLPHAHAVQRPSQAVVDRSLSPSSRAHPFIDISGGSVLQRMSSGSSLTQVPHVHASSQSGQVLEPRTTGSGIVPKIRGVPLTRSTSTTVTPRASSSWTSPITRGSPSANSSIDAKIVEQAYEAGNEPSYDSGCEESELPCFSARSSQWTYPVDKHSAPTSARSSSHMSKLGDTDIRLAAAAHRRSRLDAFGTPLPQGAPARLQEQCFVDLYADALERHQRRRERLEKVEKHESRAYKGSLSARNQSSRASTPRGASLKSYFERAELYKARHEERMAMKEEQARERVRRHEQEELEHCTFRPQINPASRRSSLLTQKRSGSVDSHVRDVANTHSRSLANLSESTGDCRSLTGSLSKAASKGSIRPMRLSVPSGDKDQQSSRRRDEAVAEIKEMLRKEGLSPM